MKYFVSRDGQQFGPYALEDLRNYVAQGNIAPNDWVRGEDSAEWVAASQVVGGGDPPAPAPPVVSPQGPGQPPAYAPSYSPAAQSYGRPATGTYPDPPEMHWALVLVLGIVTCGIFMIVWMFRQASYAQKLDPSNKSMLFYALYLVCTLLNTGSSVANMGGEPRMGLAFVGTSFALAGLACFLVGAFGLRTTLQNHFQTNEPVGLRLSGVMTFFFNTLYFQYHLSRIANWRRTGVLA